MVDGTAVTAMIGIVLTGCGGYYWLSSRPSLRLRRLEKDVRLLSAGRKNGAKADELLRRLYFIMEEAVQKEHWTHVYSGIEVLKLACGEGVAAPAEAGRLAGFSVSLLQQGHWEAAGHVVDAFRPLLRQSAVEARALILQRMTFVGIAALRARQGFLAAKVTEHLLFFLERPDYHQGPVADAGITALRMTGVMAQRRRDAELFREIGVQLNALLAAGFRPDAQLLLDTVASWLHRAVQTGSPEWVELIWDISAPAFGETPCAYPSHRRAWLEAWTECAAAACADPYSPIAGMIAGKLLPAAYREDDMPFYMEMVRRFTRMAMSVVGRHGCDSALPVIYCLLEQGRKLFQAELKFGSGADDETFRRQALFAILQETILMLEYAARQELGRSAVDVLEWLHRCWRDRGDLCCSPKAVTKYCQLLLLYWMRTHRRLARRIVPAGDLAEPALLSAADKEKMGLGDSLLLGGCP